MLHEDLITPSNGSNKPTELFTLDPRVRSAAMEQSEAMRPPSAERKYEIINQRKVKEPEETILSEEEPTLPKRRDSSLKRKEVERLNRIHWRRGQQIMNPATTEPSGKIPKMQRSPGAPIPRYPNPPQQLSEEESDSGKAKGPKRSSEEALGKSRVKRKLKEPENPKDIKSPPPPPLNATMPVGMEKKKIIKTKAVTAFGTTFHKPEPDPATSPRRRASSSSERYQRSRRVKSGEGLNDSEAGDETDVDNILRPNTRHSGERVRGSLKNDSKQSDSQEENKVMDKLKPKGLFESSSGKRARSPYHTTTKLDNKKVSSKVRLEGENKKQEGLKVKTDEKGGEIGKDLGFFEKIHQNVKAYFSSKPDLEKLEEHLEKKKVTEGEYAPNDESIEIRNDEGIEEEDFVRGDRNCMSKYQDWQMRNLSRIISSVSETNGIRLKSAEADGSGLMIISNYPPPGGNYQNCSINGNAGVFDLRSNQFNVILNGCIECTEKPRKGSFHRSTKAFQRNALALSTSPNSIGAPIVVFLEQDEQVENFTTSDGVAAASAQIQELHQTMMIRMSGEGKAACEEEIHGKRGGASLVPGKGTRDSGDGIQEEWMRYLSVNYTNCFDFERLRHDKYPEPHACSRKCGQLIGKCLFSCFCDSRKFNDYVLCEDDKLAEGGAKHKERSKSLADLYTNVFKKRKSNSRFSIKKRSVIRKKYRSDTELPELDSRTKLIHCLGNVKPIATYKKIPVFPIRRKWLVYAVHEVEFRKPGKSTETKARISDLDRNAGRPTDRLRSRTADWSREPENGLPKERSAPQRQGEQMDSLTLKDIIEMSQKIFRERSQIDVSRRRAEKLHTQTPEKKANSLQLSKTFENRRNQSKKFATKLPEKTNFPPDPMRVSDFVNKEFLKKSSDPTIEELRNAVADNKNSNMKEYLDMYRKVIRSSLSHAEQEIMDRAKLELERYTDMYYDLMKHLCLGKTSGATETSREQKPFLAKSARKIDYYEVLRDNVRRERSESRGKSPERSRQKVKSAEGSSEKRGESLKKPDDSKEEVIVELLSPHKFRGPGRQRELRKKRSMENKVLLTINVCDDGLIIKQVNDGKGNVDGKNDSRLKIGQSIKNRKDNIKTSVQGLNDEDVRLNVVKTAQEKMMEVYESTRHSVSEVRAGVSGSAPGALDKARSERVIKVDSDLTVCPKNSPEPMQKPSPNTVQKAVPVPDTENDSSVERSILKFKAFKKMLNDGLKYFNQPKELTKPKVPIQRKNEPRNIETGRKPFIEGSFERPRVRMNSWQETRPRTTKKVSMEISGKPNVAGVSEEKIRNLIHGSFPKQDLKKVQAKDLRRDCCREDQSRIQRVSNILLHNEKVIRDAIDGKKTGNVLARPKRNILAVKKPEEKKMLKELEAVASNQSEKRKILKKKPRADEKRTEDTESTADEERVRPALKKGDTRKEQSRQNAHGTPPGPFFEKRVGVKSMKNLLDQTPPALLNPGCLAEGKLVSQKPEKVEKNVDYTRSDHVADDKINDPSGVTQDRKQVYISDKPPQKEPENTVSVPSKDHGDVEKVLDQFVGNLTEAWKAALCLKEMIAPGTNLSLKEDEKSTEAKDGASFEKVNNGSSEKNGTIDSFRNFLRVLSSVLEQNTSEENVRKQLFLMVKELMAPSSNEASSKSNLFHEISRMPSEVKQMILKELIPMKSTSTMTDRDFNPVDFVNAIKNAVEELKERYLCGNLKLEESSKVPNHAARESIKIQKSSSVKAVNVIEQKKQIYYRPTKTCLLEKDCSGSIRSNLQILGEKIRRIYQEDANRISPTNTFSHQELWTNPVSKMIPRKQSLLGDESSLYFDALQSIQQFGLETGNAYGRQEITAGRALGTVALSPLDESYFSLNSKSFGKYTEIIYDKIIESLKSNNEKNVNYGMSLLHRMIQKNDESRDLSEWGETKIQSTTPEKVEIIDKLMEICQVIEQEVCQQTEKYERDLEVKMRLEEVREVKMPVEIEGPGEMARTCEYLKKHIGKMKALIMEMRYSRRDRNEMGSEMLENSRQMNMERQLIRSKIPEKNEEDSIVTHVKQKFRFESNGDFTNLINSIGTSLEKFSRTILPKWLLGRSPEKKEPEKDVKDCDSVSESSTKINSSEILLENKAVLKNLKRIIDRRQKKIQSIIEEASQKGVQREVSMKSERVARKLKELKKCYILLEKLVCDPTTPVPKWLKGEGQDMKEGSRTKGSESPVMSLLEDLVAGTDAVKSKSVQERKSLTKASENNSTRCSRSCSSLDYYRNSGTQELLPTLGYVTLVKINQAELNLDRLALKTPVEGEIGDHPRPQTV